MKQKSTLIIASILTVAFFFSSCGVLGGGKQSSPAYTSGESLGSSLLSLYGQYKETNKIDLSNPATLLSLANLATNGVKIQENWKDESFYADFASGLILGSNNKVTKSNAENVISTITGIDLSPFTQLLTGGGAAATEKPAATASSTIASTSNILSTLSGLLTSLDD